MERLSTENFKVTLDLKNGRRILGPFTLYILSELAFFSVEIPSASCLEVLD